MFIKWTLNSNDNTIYLNEQLAMFTKARNFTGHIHNHAPTVTHKLPTDAIKSPTKVPVTKHKQIPHTSFIQAPSSPDGDLFLNPISHRLFTVGGRL